MPMKFYLNWFKFASILTIITGFISVLASSEKTQLPWLFLTDLLTWPLDGSPAAFVAESFLLNAVLGGVMIGWGFLMFRLANEIPRSPQLLKHIQLALIFWFVTDSIGSYFAGVFGNIVLNISFILIFFIPITKLQKHFDSKPAPQTP